MLAASGRFMVVKASHVSKALDPIIFIELGSLILVKEEHAIKAWNPISTRFAVGKVTEVNFP